MYIYIYIYIYMYIRVYVPVYSTYLTYTIYVCTYYIYMFVSLFACLFVGIKPKKLYSTSCVRREVHPLAVIAHGQRHKPRAYQRQQHRHHVLVNLLLTLYKVTG